MPKASGQTKLITGDGEISGMYQTEQKALSVITNLDIPLYWGYILATHSYARYVDISSKMVAIFPNNFDFEDMQQKNCVYIFAYKPTLGKKGGMPLESLQISPLF